MHQLWLGTVVHYLGTKHARAGALLWPQTRFIAIPRFMRLRWPDIRPNIHPSRRGLYWLAVIIVTSVEGGMDSATFFFFLFIT